MDRSLYGKVEHGTLHPYQCSIKKGTLPGCEGSAKSTASKTYKANPKCLQGDGKLKTRAKIPIYVVEDHHRVVEHIHRNIGAKYLPVEGVTLIHFDSHPDMLIPGDMPAESAYNREELYEYLSIENWIMPLAYAGHFQNLIWLKPPWAHQIETPYQSFTIGETKDSGKLRVDCKENYYVSEALYTNTQNLSNPKTVILDVLTVGNVINEEIDDSNEIKRVVNRSEAPYVLDIDLDFFSTRNPFQDMFEHANMYERLGKIYKFDPPKSKDDAVLTQTVQKRMKQLKYLECIFTHLAEKKEMPEASNGEDQNYIDLVAELRTHMLQHYKEEKIDWLLVHSAGCTRDDSELPHHPSSREEIDLMLQSFRNFLELLQKPPVIITISRSTEDDFTPFQHVENIQSGVLKILSEKFECDKPELCYLLDSD